MTTWESGLHKSGSGLADVSAVLGIEEVNPSGRPTEAYHLTPEVGLFVEIEK